MTNPLDALRIRAANRFASGDLRGARADWLEVLRLVPGSGEAMLEVSYLESVAGNYLEARSWAMRAASAPLSGELVPSLLSRLRTFNEVTTMRELVVRLIEQGTASGDLLAECARQLNGAGDFKLAERAIMASLAHSPENLHARMIHGQVRAQQSRFDDAEREFEWVLARNPNLAHCWWLLSRLRRQTPERNHVARIGGLIRACNNPQDAALLARALHKELDDIGQFEHAWEALELLCRIKRRLEPYDPNEVAGMMDRLIAQSPGWRPAATDPGNGLVPIFIVGMHRSGTTLLEHLLDASDEVRALGELVDFTSAMRHATNHYCKGALDSRIVDLAAHVDFADVGRRYLAGVSWRLGGEAYFTDKQPSNFLNVGFILRALPRAKILHMVRDPLETCFSNLRELFTGVNAYSYDQEQLASYYLQYLRLMEHWHSLFPGQILDVSYAALTSTPGQEMAKVAAFCGLQYVDGMRQTSASGRAVSTASSVQVREGVVRRETPKWAPYARQLQPLADALRAGGIKLPAV